MDKSVSIIAPAYNHEKYVESCLRSVANQKCEEMELIVLDDCSTDGTPNVIRQLIDEESFRKAFSMGIRFIQHKKNKGAHNTINEGLEIAKGKYLAVINTDDAFGDNRLDRLLDACEREGSEFAFGGVRVVDENDKTLTEGYASGIITHQNTARMCPTVTMALTRGNSTISTGNMVFSSRLYRELGGFRSYKYAHDWDFALRAALITEPLFVPDAYYIYRLHSANTISELATRPQDAYIMENGGGQSGKNPLTEFLLRVLKGQYTNKKIPPREAWEYFFAYKKYQDYDHDGPDAWNEAKKLLADSPGEPTSVLCTKHTRFIGQLIQNSLKKAGITADVLMEEPAEYGDNMYIVVCPQMFQRLPNHYISFQMEQTISSRWLNEKYLNGLRDSTAVLDYSLKNIEYFREHTDFAGKFYYLPIDYLPGIRRDSDDYEYDVVFYGDPDNDRRRAALEKLSQHFNVTILSEVFGEELHAELSRAKVVVNIHYYENAMLETTRLYETLSLGRSMIVSERSSDSHEDARLEGIVDFVPADDFDAMVDRVSYWLSHEEERKAAVDGNNDLLANRSSAFDYYFLRFMLANDWLSFDDFYRLAGDYIHFDTNHVCLSLPESLERGMEFRAEIRDKKIDFEIFPALRHRRAWTGCGLSYKFIMKKAQEQNMDKILVCEDDVLLPDDFDYRWEQCEKYLNERDDWDVFQGMMADIGDVNISDVQEEYGQTFVHMDRMISTVFNYYRNSIFEHILAWDEHNDDADTNAIDRALESQELRVVCTHPFLVGHKENLDSDIWGFNNSHYLPQIESSIEKLNKRARK